MHRSRLSFVVAISAAAITQSAFAADLPVKAPIAQPAAPASVGGYIEAYTAAAWDKDTFQNPVFGPNNATYHGWVLGGAGRGNWWATPSVSLQLDAQAEGTQYTVPSNLLAPGFNGHFSTLDYLIAGHVNWRNQQTGLLGVFGGIGDAGGNVSTGGFNNNGVRHGLIGAEGQYYLGALTLYGQGGYDATMSSGNIAFFNSVHAWFLRATGRYFIDPNLMIEGTAQYDRGAVGYPAAIAVPSTGFTMWQWRAKVEWKPSTLPFSFFAAYQGSRNGYGFSAATGTVSEKVTDNRAVVGLRLYMGENTLLANDRAGATLDIFDPLGSPTSPIMLFPRGQQIFVSDARLKRDIGLIGRLDNGLGLYSYRYLWSDTVYVGVMAQEVALIRPDAVVHGLDGYLRVDYSRLGLSLMTLSQWNVLSTAARL